MQAEYRRVPDASGKSRDIRVIKEIKLWEYSPVIWGINPATATVGAKEDTGRATGGPFNINIPYLAGLDGAETFIFHDVNEGCAIYRTCASQAHRRLWFLSQLQVKQHQAQGEQI